MCGIIQTEYDRYRDENSEEEQPVRNITHDEGYDIYYHSYWLPKCPSLKPGINLSFFDNAVNMGPTGATYVLQHALGIDVDGIWGPNTDAAVAAITDVPAFIEKFAAARLAAYRFMEGWPYFHNGWTARTNTIEAASIKMATAPVGLKLAVPLLPYVASQKVMDMHLRMPIRVAA